MTNNNHISPFEHPIALGSFRSWLRLLRDYGGVEHEYLIRGAFVTATTLLTSPLRLYERLRYDGALRRVTVDQAPIFIIGHWRTGTTHLHNLLCRDPGLGYVTLFQAIAPGFCLSTERVMMPVLSRILNKSHPTRIIDNIPLLFDGPQEEEFAISNMSPHSFLHSYSFPRHADLLFDRNVLFEGLPEASVAEWREIYLTFLRKVTLRTGGKRLVLKNPANAGRIPELLAMLPDARFIYTVRNPYDLFPSVMNVYRNIVPRSQVERFDWAQLEEHVLCAGARVVRKFQADRALIPPGHLVEVRFEDLERAPLDEVRRVYQELDLPGYAEAEPPIRAYLASIQGYQKNRYPPNGDVIAKVNRHWGLMFDAWGYEQRDVG